MRWASPISERLGTWRFSISKIVPEHRRRLIMGKLGRLCLPSHWNRVEFFNFMKHLSFLLSLLSMIISCMDGCLSQWIPHDNMKTKNWFFKCYKCLLTFGDVLIRSADLWAWGVQCCMAQQSISSHLVTFCCRCFLNDHHHFLQVWYL